MSDLTPIGLEFRTVGADAANRAADQYTDKVGKAEKATDSLASSQRGAGSATAQMLANIERAVVELAEMARLQNSAGASAAMLAKYSREAGAAAREAAAGWTVGTKQLDAHVIALRKAQEQLRETPTLSNRASAGLLNLSRNFADVGVTAAMGMSPLLILIQQGPQIADAMGEIRRGGISVSAAMKQMAASAWAAVAPFAPFIAAGAAAAAILGGGFLLAARNANKETGDLTKGLGLTEAQLERVKQKTVTVGDTFMATFTVIGRHIKDGPLGTALDWIATKWGQMLDGITSGAIAAAAGVAAAFSAAGKAMTGGDFMKEFNASFGANTKGINSFFGEITKEAAARRTKQIKEDAGAGRSSTAPRDQTDERTAQVAQALAQAQQDELQARLGLTRDIVARAAIEKQIAASALQEKQAQVDKQIASLADDKGLSAAKKAELTAQLEAVKATNAKAAGLRAELIDRQTQEALDNQSLEQRREIAGYYDRITAANSGLATSATELNAIEAQALRQRQIDERVEQETRLAHSALSEAAKAQAVTALKDAQAAENVAQARAARVRLEEEANARAEAGLNRQIDALSRQSAAAGTETERVGIAQRILALEHQLERLKLEEVIFSSQATMAEKAIAIARLNQLAKDQKNDLAAAAGTLSSNFQEAADAVKNMASAFKSRNWFGAAAGLDQAMANFRAAFGPGGTFGGKIGAVAGLAGGAIGGKAGSALMGAAAGAGLGAGITATAAMIGTSIAPGIGTAIGAAIGLVAGLFGGGSSKKADREAAAQKEAERQAQITQARQQQEILTLQLEGKAVEALALQRKYELAAIDESLRAGQERIYQLQDEAEAIAKAKAASDEARTWEQRRLTAVGDTAGALKLQRQAELEGVSDANKGLALFVWALEDYKTAQDAATESAKEAAATAKQLALDLYAQASARVDEARSALSEAIQRETGEIQGRIDGLNNLIQTLRDFGATLNDGASATQRYAQARAAFDRAAANDNAALPSTGAAFLAVSKENAKTQLEFARDQAAVKNATKAAVLLAESQISIEQQSLTALNASVAGLGIINQSVLTVAQAIANLQGALTVQATAAAGAMDPQWGAVQNVDVNKALASATGFGGAFGAGGFQSFITQASAKQQDSARLILQAYGQGNRIQGFATGGDHMGGLRIVGEHGPELEATGPSRIISNDRLQGMLSGSDGGVEAKLDILIALVREIMGDGKKGANAVEMIRVVLMKITRGRSAVYTKLDEAA